MASLADTQRYIPTVAAAVAGFFTAFVLFRRNPVASMLTLSGGDFNFIAAVLVLGAPVLLVARTKTLPFPDRWGLFALLGMTWAVISLGINQGIASAMAPLAALFTLFFATLISFFIPAQGKLFLMWGPSALLLLHQFAISILQGPLSGGFFGQGTGSIAFGHLMALGFLISYFASLNSSQQSNFFFAVSAVFMVGVMLSGSRGALLGLAVGLALVQLGILFGRNLRAMLRELRRIIYLGSLTALPFLLPSQQSVPVIQRKLTQTFELSEEVGSLQIPIYSAGRWEIWAETWSEFENLTDVVIGIGQSSVETIFGATYPHNLFLELLLIGGLLTLVPFFLFLITVFRKTFDQTTTDRFEFFVLAITVGVFSMFSGDLSYNVIFFYFVGLAYGQILRKAGRFKRLD